MNFNSKKTSLSALVVTALAGSKLLLSLFSDPEGNNLAVVAMMALIVFFVSLPVYAYGLPKTARGSEKVALAVIIQALTVAALYFFLR